MGNTYGRQLLSPQVGMPLSVLANYDDVDWHPIGITLDWSTVTAVGSDVTTDFDNVIVRAGQKALRYGQVLVKITSGPSTGKWGPYDTAALDGRAAVARGGTVLLDRTVLENGPIPGLLAGPTNHPAGFEGGLAWKARILDSTATNPFAAAGPTFSDLEGALPELRYLVP